MTKEITEPGKVITSISPEEMKLDNQIKRVLACKPILSRILQGVVEECKGMTCDEVENCIEGDVLIEKTIMDPGLTNIIEGSNIEDFVPGEGFIKYDIRTYLRLPGDAEPQLTKILIDVEAQKEENPGYDIPVRGLFYCCRMISSQLGTEFSNSSKDKKKYGNIKKVYSIWLCTETSQKRANSIEKYGITKEIICGTNDDEKRYDLMSAIIINLSKDHDCADTESELIRMLTDLLNETLSAEEKLRIMKEEYNVQVTKELEKEVAAMCTYTTNVEKKGAKKGETKLASLITLMIQKGDSSNIERVAADETVRTEFYKKYGITD